MNKPYQAKDLEDLMLYTALRKISFLYEAKHRSPDSFSNRFLYRVLNIKRPPEDRILSGCCIFRELEEALKKSHTYDAFAPLFNFNKEVFLNQDINNFGPYILQGILKLEDIINGSTDNEY